MIQRAKQLLKQPSYTVARLTLLEELARQLRTITPGATLDVGGGRAPFRELVPHTTYTTLDINPDKGADICADVRHIPRDAEQFDTVLATEMLEHIPEPHKAIDEIHRVLKKDGTCVLSTRFIHPIHGSPHDYFRFTEDGLRHLFSAFGDVKVFPLGGQPQAVWLLMTYPRSRRRPLTRLAVGALARMVSRLAPSGTTMPLGYLVVARKR